MIKRFFSKHKLSLKKISLVLALVFLIVGGFLVRPLLAERVLVLADYYFNGGAYNLSVAANWYRVANFLGSDSHFIHYQLARIYFVENKLSEAKKEIDIALASNPDNQRAFYIRGLIDGFAKNYEEAISDFEKFTTWSPKEWAGWNDLAWASCEAGNYAKAREAALRGLRLGATNPWLLNNLGLAYLGLGKKGEAQAVFAKAKNSADLLTAEEWRRAYPGNNPDFAEQNLVRFKADVKYNAALAFESTSLSLATLNGVAISACAASTYGTCGAGTCSANACTVCDSVYDINCCADYVSQCSNFGGFDAACCVANFGASCNSCGGTVLCDGSCSVQNCPPTPSNTGSSALIVTQPNYCLTGPAATFSWPFYDPDGDTQSAYQIQADNNSDFSSPEIDSGVVSSASNAYASGSGRLVYNTTYYWRVIVRDDKNQWSLNPASGPSFTTPAHQYPAVDFTWSPSSPSQGEEVQFTDKSKCYTVGGSQVACPVAGFYWTFQDGDPANSTLQNPVVKFSSTGSKTITLRVADAEAFTCSATNSELTKVFKVKIKLPSWKEVSP